MSDRIAQIRALLEKDPNDVFLHYSLGKELLSAGSLDDALAAFRTCTELDANYLPARVEAGRSLRAAGRLDEARTIFQDALTIAQEQGEQHTADNLRQQLEALTSK